MLLTNDPPLDSLALNLCKQFHQGANIPKLLIHMLNKIGHWTQAVGLLCLEVGKLLRPDKLPTKNILSARLCMFCESHTHVLTLFEVGRHKQYNLDQPA